jgi:hypothetical protein
MDCIGNLSGLSLHVDDDLAVIAVNTDIVTSETYFSKGASDNLLEVNLLLVNVDLAQKHNLQITMIISLQLTIPVLVAVSIATLELGSILKQASRIASETWSQSLSGCPSPTDSEAK